MNPNADLLALLSRELRVPLSSIKGSTAILLDSADRLDPAELREFHAIIDAQADRMNLLASDLRVMADIESSSLSVNPEPTDVALLLQDARDSLIAGVFSNVLHVVRPSGLPWVMADRPRISRALNVLLANAAEHAREDTPISIEAARHGDFVTVSVSHEPAGEEPRRFRSRTRLPGDGGLALAVCQGIVEAHGGSLWTETGAAGQPSTISISIPIADEPWRDASDRSPAPLTLSPDGPRRAAPRVLALDDDPQTLMSVRDIITGAGFDAFATGDPDEALRIVDDVRPHLALLELLLPGTDGIELMDAITRKADVTVMFLSAYRREDAISRALDAGAVDYVVKPFSPVELAARIRVALRGRGALELAEPFRLKELEIDYAERRVSLAGEPVQLTSIEYRLLRELATNSGRVLTYDHLLRHVWGVAGDSDVRPMRTIISNLRRKLQDNPDTPTYITTQPRTGYRLG